VIKQILEVENITDKEVIEPSLTKKVIAVIMIGATASVTNVQVAKNVNQLFKHSFYKVILTLVDYFVKIALFASAVSFQIIFVNTFMVIGYCMLYLEEIIGARHVKDNHQFLQGSGIDEDEDSSNLHENTLIDFIRVIWKKKYTRRIALFFVANLGFMFVEVLYGYLTNSLGLISDAIHMAFDCLALLVGLIASYLAQGEYKGYSYGMTRIEVLSGFFNGVFLIFIAFKVLCESVDRIYEPQLIEEQGLLTVSVLGLVVNIIGLS
jgi:solute carrier family 30 (zinc transporter), member 5/7